MCFLASIMGWKKRIKPACTKLVESIYHVDRKLKYERIYLVMTLCFGDCNNSIWIETHSMEAYSQFNNGMIFRWFGDCARTLRTAWRWSYVFDTLVEYLFYLVIFAHSRHDQTCLFTFQSCSIMSAFIAIYLCMF